MTKTNKINGGPGMPESLGGWAKEREGWILNIFLSSVRASEEKNSQPC